MRPHTFFRTASPEQRWFWAILNCTWITATGFLTSLWWLAPLGIFGMGLAYWSIWRHQPPRLPRWPRNKATKPTP